MNYKNYSFFKGETECPFEDFGRSFWWRIESEAAFNNDNKNPGELSPTMWNYLREKMWQGDNFADTTEAEFQERVRRLYSLGLWSRSYISEKNCPIYRAVKENH